MDESSSRADRAQLLAAWRALAVQRKLRQRDIAQALGVSEGELVAARVGDNRRDASGSPHDRVTRIDAGPRRIDFVRALQPLGRVMALTRNCACVHEKDGVYNNVDGGDRMGLVLDPEIDLRLFLEHWQHVFAVEESGPRGRLRSLQIYDRWGEAVHKVFLREHSYHATYNALVAARQHADQTPALQVDTTPPRALPAPDPDLMAFQAGWLAMQDTHEFFPLLRKHALPRRQALRLAPAHHAARVGNDTIATLLARATKSRAPIMVFVGNRGCIQIHSGEIHRVAPMDAWLNVLDPGFNLHLRTDLIAETWWVKKPTADGPVHSLELLDAAGETIAFVFGARKPGKPELAAWVELLDSCCAQHAAGVTA